MGHAEPSSDAKVAVVVAYSPRAGVVDEVSLRLPAGATVADALARSGLHERHAAVDFKTLRVGVWGKLREPGELLRDRDRVEFYRPLTVDPKEARRLRYRQHRERYAAK
jgi:putative ubiquitin-RnfH superfamily antitoxin RatB of RatAB toxin-antitoxin module